MNVCFIDLSSFCNTDYKEDGWKYSPFPLNSLFWEEKEEIVIKIKKEKMKGSENVNSTLNINWETATNTLHNHFICKWHDMCSGIVFRCNSNRSVETIKLRPHLHTHLIVERRQNKMAVKRKGWISIYGSFVCVRAVYPTD